MVYFDDAEATICKVETNQPTDNCIAEANGSIDVTETADFPFRHGASCNVTVDTRSK